MLILIFFYSARSPIVSFCIVLEANVVWRRWTLSLPTMCFDLCWWKPCGAIWPPWKRQMLTISACTWSLTFGWTIAIMSNYANWFTCVLSPDALTDVIGPSLERRLIDSQSQVVAGMESVIQSRCTVGKRLRSIAFGNRDGEFKWREWALLDQLP